ncbi:extracellular solute-binding protein [Seminavis robusta]|uniref:Extracellular solute-binding protein n=1 Tax=Seminavis robusta TaxID=568900 RepID=A0A9N8DXE0_9STRA|nr:extracellular solute-binding protein [Seminavis robusta]|eukprot:Sro441_g143660.1 extracellular solute-binding protein (832) ;mRNA; r:25670-28316
MTDRDGAEQLPGNDADNLCQGIDEQQKRILRHILNDDLSDNETEDLVQEPDEQQKRIVGHVLGDFEASESMAGEEDRTQCEEKDQGGDFAQKTRPTADNGSLPCGGADFSAAGCGGSPEPMGAPRLSRGDTRHPVQQSRPGAYQMAGTAMAGTASSMSRAVTTDSTSTNSSSPPETAIQAHLVTANESPSSTRTASVENATNRERRRQSRNQSPLVEGKPVEEDWKIPQELSLVCILLLVSVVVLLSVGLTGGFDGETTFHNGAEDSNSTAVGSKTEQHGGNQSNLDGHEKCSNSPLYYDKHLSTFAQIRKRGVLKAGFPLDIVKYPYLTKAIAAGILGPAAPVDFIQIDKFTDHFNYVDSGAVDIVLTGVTHNMQRDVLWPFSFSIPFSFDGIRTAGIPFYVQCAEDGLRHLDECSGLRMCVAGNTTHYAAIREHLPRKHIVLAELGMEIMFRFIEGECNVLVNEGALIQESFLRSLSVNGTKYTGDYAIGNTYFTREPFVAVTRKDDPEFSDFVNAILMGLMAAEKDNITQATSHLMPETSLFGDDYKYMFQDSVAVGGNLAEAFHHNFGIYPRSPFDTINNGTSGLLFAHPFGDISSNTNPFGCNTSDKPSLGLAFDNVVQRGKFRCGVDTSKPGFATPSENQSYSGMDVDYCKALAAGLFQGDEAAVEFVEVEDETDGYALLASNEIDILAGVTWTLQNDVKEPTTNQGYSFSIPYFYGYSPNHDNFCLATRQDDPDWSRFVYWIVMSTFYAEEHGIGHQNSSLMPEVFVYGPKMNRVFRDAILAVGSYAEIYERNVEALMPRSGRNFLNGLSKPGPQHYVRPDFLV